MDGKFPHAWVCKSQGWLRSRELTGGLLARKEISFLGYRQEQNFPPNLTQANSNTDYSGITVKVIKKLACLESKKRFKV